MISMIIEGAHHEIIKHMKKHGAGYLKAAGTTAGAVGLYHLAAAASSADDAGDARDDAKKHLEKSLHHRVLAQHHATKADEASDDSTGAKLKAAVKGPHTTVTRPLIAKYHGNAAEEHSDDAKLHSHKNLLHAKEAEQEKKEVKHHLKKAILPTAAAATSGVGVLHMKSKKTGGYQLKKDSREREQ